MSTGPGKLRLAIMALLLIAAWYALALTALSSSATRLIEPRTVRSRLETCIHDAFSTAQAQHRDLTAADIRAAVAADAAFANWQWQVEVHDDLSVTATTSKPPVVIHPTWWERVLLLRRTIRKEWPTVRVEKPNPAYEAGSGERRHE